LFGASCKEGPYKPGPGEPGYRDVDENGEAFVVLASRDNIKPPPGWKEVVLFRKGQGLHGVFLAPGGLRWVSFPIDGWENWPEGIRLKKNGARYDVVEPAKGASDSLIVLRAEGKVQEWAGNNVVGSWKVEWAATDVAWVHASSLNLRDRPEKNASVGERLPINAKVEVLALSGAFTKVRVLEPSEASGSTGWLASGFLGHQPLVLKTILAEAETEADTAKALSLWQRAWALDEGNPEIGAKLVAAYDTAGRKQAARFWKKQVADTVLRTKLMKGPLKGLGQSYFRGDEAPQANTMEPAERKAFDALFRDDVMGKGCGELSNCFVTWEGPADALTPVPLTCRKPNKDEGEALLASKLVRRWTKQSRSPELRVKSPRVTRAATLDLNGDGKDERVWTVNIETSEKSTEEPDWPMGPPYCTRPVLEVGEKWVAITPSSCSRSTELHGEEIVGAFRVKDVRGVVLVVRQHWLGAAGSALFLWRDGVAVQLDDRCAGNG
jgi:hypothetical protein